MVLAAAPRSAACISRKLSSHSCTAASAWTRGLATHLDPGQRGGRFPLGRLKKDGHDVKPADHGGADDAHNHQKPHKARHVATLLLIRLLFEPKRCRSVQTGGYGPAYAPPRVPSLTRIAVRL